MSKTTVELQTGLIQKCSQISNKLILVSNEDCDQMLLDTDWTVTNKINVPKANYNFERYIYILNK